MNKLTCYMYYHRVELAAHMVEPPVCPSQVTERHGLSNKSCRAIRALTLDSSF